MNKVILIGNLVRDVELSTTPRPDRPRPRHTG